MDNNLILNVILAVVRLIHDAFNGDTSAQQKLKDILPNKLHTQIVREAQDKLDAKKFGPRK